MSYPPESLILSGALRAHANIMKIWFYCIGEKLFSTEYFCNTKVAGPCIPPTDVGVFPIIIKKIMQVYYH